MNVCFHKTDVTPKRPCRMGGYERKKESIGVLDAIEVHTMALTIDRNTLLLAMIDCICLSKEFVEKVTSAVAQRTKVPIAQVSISCIHTHSAPCYFKLTFEEVQAEKELTDALAIQVIEDLCYCYHNQKEATLTYEYCDIDGIYGNRNVKEKWSDKRFHVLKFMEDTQCIGIFCNISTHPTLLGGDNYLLSSDLLGRIRSKLEQFYQTTVLISNGACGDVSTRFYRTGNGLEETATAIMEQYQTKKIEKYQTLYKGKFYAVQQRVEVDFTRDPIHHAIRVQLETLDTPTKSLFLHKCDLKEAMSPFSLELNAEILDAGDILFITLPGDILSGFGRQLKDAFPDKTVILICYTGNYCNYFVPQEEYGQYFETFNSRLPKGEADKFIHKIIETAKSHIYID